LPDDKRDEKGEVSFSITTGTAAQPLVFTYKAPARLFIQKFNELLGNFPNMFENLKPFSGLEENESMIKFVAGAYVVSPSDSAVIVDASAGNVLISLPTATYMGLHILIVKEDASANTVQVAAYGNDTIEGSPSKTLSAQYSKVYLVSDGVSQWYVISSA